MRIYMDFNEVYSETQRNIYELGIHVHPKTYQDKYVADDPGFETMELQNYEFMLINPSSENIKPFTIQPWADLEFEERITDTTDKEKINPGKAWEARKDVWEQFIEPSTGKFGYSYNERLWSSGQLNKIINRIKEDPESRQLWLSIWNPDIDIDKLGGVSRVPCSLGYHFMVREGQLNMTYLMRSNDFGTHFADDVYEAVKLLEYVSKKTGYKVGNFNYWCGSLHLFKKDYEVIF